MVVVVFGLPGSGKSYFAERLAEGLSAVYLSSDILRRELLAERKYSKDERRYVYECLFDRMERALRNKAAVVMDATFGRRNLREQCRQRARAAGAPAHFIEIRATEELVKERLATTREHSEADLNVYQMLKQDFEAMSEPHLVIESDNSDISDRLMTALSYVQHS